MWKSAIILILGIALSAIKGSHGHPHTGSHEDDGLSEDIEFLKRFLQRELGTDGSHAGHHHGSHEDDRRSPDVDISEQFREHMGKLGVDSRTNNQLKSDRTYYEIDENDFLEQESKYSARENTERDSLIVVGTAPQSENELEVICEANQYQCPNEPICLKSRKLCDGTSDCQDGSDENAATCEAFYQTLCRKNAKYFCWSGSRPVCLLRGKMCDGSQECDDASDELKEKCEAMPKCERYWIKGKRAYQSCTGSLQCLWHTKWCNGVDECVNGADETTCSASEENSETENNTVGSTDVDVMCGGNLLCKEAVLAHNYLRSAHKDTPSVTWNADLASRAQAWSEESVKNGAYGYSNPGSQFRQNSGENIAVSFQKDYLIAGACKNWYIEQFNTVYNYETGIGNKNIAFYRHFSQMMWDDSVEIGCGQTSGEVGTFIVCHYSPPGNIRNEFTRHVHPPIMGIDIKTRLRALGQYVQDKMQPIN